MRKKPSTRRRLMQTKQTRVWESAGCALLLGKVGRVFFFLLNMKMILVDSLMAAALLVLPGDHHIGDLSLLLHLYDALQYLVAQFRITIRDDQRLCGRGRCSHETCPGSLTGRTYCPFPWRWICSVIHHGHYMWTKKAQLRTTSATGRPLARTWRHGRRLCLVHRCWASVSQLWQLQARSRSPGSLFFTDVASAEWPKGRILDCQSVGRQFEPLWQIENLSLSNFLEIDLWIPATGGSRHQNSQGNEPITAIAVKIKRLSSPYSSCCTQSNWERR